MKPQEIIETLDSIYGAEYWRKKQRTNFLELIELLIKIHGGERIPVGTVVGGHKIASFDRPHFHYVGGK